MEFHIFPWENDDSRADLGVTTLSADKATSSRFHRRTARTFRQWCRQWESSSEERHSAFVACDVLWCSLGVHKLPESPVGSLGSALPSRIISPHSIMDHGSSRIITDHHGSSRIIMDHGQGGNGLCIRDPQISSFHCEAKLSAAEVMWSHVHAMKAPKSSWDIMRCHEMLWVSAISRKMGNSLPPCRSAGDQTLQRWLNFGRCDHLETASCWMTSNLQNIYELDIFVSG